MRIRSSYSFMYQSWLDNLDSSAAIESKANGVFKTEEKGKLNISGGNCALVVPLI